MYVPQLSPPPPPHTATDQLPELIAFTLTTTGPVVGLYSPTTATHTFTLDGDPDRATSTLITLRDPRTASTPDFPSGYTHSARLGEVSGEGVVTSVALSGPGPDGPVGLVAVSGYLEPTAALVTPGALGPSFTLRASTARLPFALVPGLFLTTPATSADPAVAAVPALTTPEGQSLGPNSLVFTAVHADGGDPVVQVTLLQDLPASTSLTFTDLSWTADPGVFEGTSQDGVVVYTAPVDLRAGTRLTMDVHSPAWARTDGDFRLPAVGDSIAVFAGSSLPDDPTTALAFMQYGVQGPDAAEVLHAAVQGTLHWTPQVPAPAAVVVGPLSGFPGQVARAVALAGSWVSSAPMVDDPVEVWGVNTQPGTPSSRMEPLPVANRVASLATFAGASVVVVGAYHTAAAGVFTDLARPAVTASNASRVVGAGHGWWIQAYDTSSLRAVQCHDTCLTCHGAGEDGCSSCDATVGRYLLGSRCVTAEECTSTGSGVAQQMPWSTNGLYGECTGHCPFQRWFRQFEYDGDGDVTAQACVRCDASCRECYGSTPVDCSRCHPKPVGGSKGVAAV